MKPGEHSFQIDSAEGLPIRGVIHVPRHPTCTVVLVHGFKGFKDWGFFPWLADYLCQRRFTVCRFDFSRNGIGERPGEFDRLDLFADDTYSIELADFRSVINHLTEILGEHPTFVVGHSRGGAMAILGSDAIPRLQGIITWNSIARADRWDAATVEKWRREGSLDFLNMRTKQLMRMSTRVLDDLERNRDRFAIGAAAARLRVPMLILHGGSDETVPVSEASVLASKAPDSSLVIIESGTHTFGATHPLREIPRTLALAAKLTAHFISLHCRPS